MVTIENIKNVLQNSPSAYLVMYPDAPKFTVAYANNAFLAIANINPESIINKGFVEILKKYDSERNFKNILAIENSLEYALRLKEVHKIAPLCYEKPRKGTDEVDALFWNAQTYPLFDDQENVQFIVFTPSDVTHAFNSVKNGNAINTDDYPDSIFTIDLEGNFISFNKELIELVECPKEDLLKLSFIPFTRKEDLEIALNYFQKSKSGEIQNFEIPITTAKGNYRFVKITSIPIRVKEEVVGVYLIAKNITALKLAERQIEEYNHQISSILESITDAFYALDKNWIVTYWNKEAENVLKRSREEMMGKNIWEMFPGATSLKYYSEYQKAMNENISVRFEESASVLNISVEVTVYPSSNGLSVYFKDITQRLKADKELNEAKISYQNLFELNPLPNFVIDRHTLAFLDVNQATINNYGYNKQELLSMTVRDITSKDHLFSLDEILDSAQNPNLVHKSLVQYIIKSGERIAVHTKWKSIIYDGKLAFNFIAMDVTEKQASKQALIKSEQRFKALIQDGSDLIYILDQEGNYRYVNSNTKLILGLDPDYFIGKNAYNFIHGDDQERIIECFALLANQKRVEILPYRFVDGYGHIKWIESIITDMTNDPAVEGIVVNSRDVTQRIEDEIKIQEIMERYHVVLKATSDAIYDWDLVKDELLWGEGFTTNFGHQHNGTFTAERWKSLLHPEESSDLFKKFQFHIKNKKTRLTNEYRFLCADGTYKFVMDRSVLIYDQEGKCVRMIGAVQDITERINYIQAMEVQNKQLNEISWIQSHLVRAPLAQIIGLAELIDYDEEEIDKKILIGKLIISAHELDSVIMEIVKKSKISNSNI